MTKNLEEKDLKHESDAAYQQIRDRLSVSQSHVRERDRRIATLLRDAHNVESAVESIARGVEGLPVPRKVVYPKPKLHHEGSTALLNLADLHAEEYVDPQEMEGYARFDWGVFMSRLWATGEKTLELVNILRQSGPITKLVINCLGDFLTGAIHKELDDTNTLDLPVAIPSTGWILAQLVQALAPHFDEVELYCVAGNHGRMDDKPRYKKKARRNWDTSVYRIAQILTRDDKTIKWNIPDSASCWYKIPGLRVLIKHGDSIQMQGVVPYYGIARDNAKEHKKRRGGKDFDVCFQGHLHMYSVVEERILCPSLIGTNEYAFYKLHSFQPPAQLLAFANRKHGLTCQWLIDLRKSKGHKFVE